MRKEREAKKVYILIKIKSSRMLENNQNAKDPDVIIREN